MTSDDSDTSIPPLDRRNAERLSPPLPRCLMKGMRLNWSMEHLVGIVDCRRLDPGCRPDDTQSSVVASDSSSHSELTGGNLNTRERQLGPAGLPGTDPVHER